MAFLEDSYQQVRLVLAEYHSVNLDHLQKADAIRFYTSVEVAKQVYYPELADIEAQVFAYCQNRLIIEIKEALSNILGKDIVSGNKHPTG